MWDFSLSRALGAMAKTAPFIAFRMLIYFGIFLAYVLAVGFGAGIGYGIASIGDDPSGGIFFGGLVGFGVVSAALYWAREYVLYLVKAGHIAVLVKDYDGEPLPGGRGQIEHAHAEVRAHFATTSVLFGVDRIIKGILRTLNRTVFRITGFIPGLDGLASFANKVLNLSLTFTDELILAHILRTRAENHWQASQDALILYAQNYKAMLKNAFFLLLLMYAVTFVVFLVILGPVGALMALFPGSVGGWTFVLALAFALAFNAALLQPLAVAALMQVFFDATEGQVPDPAWEARLSSASEKFRELKTEAQSYVPRPTQASDLATT